MKYHVSLLLVIAFTPFQHISAQEEYEYVEEEYVEEEAPPESFVTPLPTAPAPTLKPTPAPTPAPAPTPVPVAATPAATIQAPAPAAAPAPGAIATQLAWPDTIALDESKPEILDPSVEPIFRTTNQTIDDSNQTINTLDKQRDDLYKRFNDFDSKTDDIYQDAQACIGQKKQELEGFRK